MIPPRRPLRGWRAHGGHALRGPESLESRRLMAVFTVNSFADILSPPAGTVTLRSAIQAANTTAGTDTINLPFAGTYKITMIGSAIDNSAGELAIADSGNLTIQNTSNGAVTIDGGGLNRVFDVDPAGSAVPFNVIFRGLTITGGVSSFADKNGGGIDAHGGAGVALAQCIVTGDIAASGGGIAMDVGSTGTLVVAGTQVAHDVAEGLGGGVAGLGSGVVAIGSGSVIRADSASTGGGVAIAAGAGLIIAGSTLEDNRSAGTGGGIDTAGGSSVAISGSLIERNSASGAGGGYNTAGAGDSLTVADSFFLDNSAERGGGIESSGSLVAITGSTLAGNSAVENGGGAEFAATKTALVTDSEVVGNSSEFDGGGIAFDSNSPSAVELDVAGSTVEDNFAEASGGGVYSTVLAGNVAINSSLVGGNVAGIGGGASITGGTSEVGRSRFTGNTASFSGALDAHDSAFSLVDSDLDDNRAFYTAGALTIDLGALPCSIGDDTFDANAAGTHGGAIVIENDGPAALGMSYDTIDGNTAAATAGGVDMTGGVLNVQGTIIAEDTAAGAASDFAYVAGTVTDGGGNLLGSTSGDGGEFGSGTIVGDPKLGPLLDNGGFRAGAPSSSQVIPTQALLPGSPAFAKGVAAGAPNTDERGFARHTNPSIGAYEPQYSNTAPANPLFVDVLYEVLFNHPVDPAGLVACTNFLNNGGSPTALIQILQSSNEYLDDEVAQLFHRYLDRAPTSPEFSSFSTALEVGRHPRAGRRGAGRFATSSSRTTAATTTASSSRPTRRPSAAPQHRARSPAGTRCSPAACPGATSPACSSRRRSTSPT